MRILIVEDSEERIKKFKQKLINHDVVYTKFPIEAICLMNAEIFDYCFLDHDLGDQVFVESGPGTGYEVAKWIAENPEHKPRHILIHSLNNIGAAQMMRVLGNVNIKATYIPFLWDKIEL